MSPVSTKAITLLFLSGTLGCGAVKRVHECKAVIEAVNDGVGELHLQVPDAGTSAASYAAIADGYDALGQRLARLAPSDPTLAKALESYRELTQRAAKTSRAYSEALAAPGSSKRLRVEKQARLDRIRAEAQSDVSREALVVRKLNGVCHPQQ
jgi:ribonuclease D